MQKSVFRFRTVILVSLLTAILLTFSACSLDGVQDKLQNLADALNADDEPALESRIWDILTSGPWELYAVKDTDGSLIMAEQGTLSFNAGLQFYGYGFQNYLVRIGQDTGYQYEYYELEMSLQAHGYSYVAVENPDVEGDFYSPEEFPMYEDCPNKEWHYRIRPWAGADPETGETGEEMTAELWMFTVYDETLELWKCGRDENGDQTEPYAVWYFRCDAYHPAGETTASASEKDPFAPQ